MTKILQWLSTYLIKNHKSENTFVVRHFVQPVLFFHLIEKNLLSNQKIFIVITITRKN